MIKKIILILFIISTIFFSNHCLAEDSGSGRVKPINTSELFGGSFVYTGDDDTTTGDATTTIFLKTVITKLIVGIGFVSLFIMTIGGAYMIFSNGQDDILKRGKSIFLAGIIALIVALSSGLIMRLVIYLLYN